MENSRNTRPAVFIDSNTDNGTRPCLHGPRNVAATGFSVPARPCYSYSQSYRPFTPSLKYETFPFFQDWTPLSTPPSPAGLIRQVFTAPGLASSNIMFFTPIIRFQCRGRHRGRLWRLHACSVPGWPGPRHPRQGQLTMPAAALYYENVSLLSVPMTGDIMHATLKGSIDMALTHLFMAGHISETRVSLL